jgi:hypothetical protein
MEWKRRTSTKIKPPGFVEPAFAVLTHRAPSGPRWLHEIKHDGYRLICRTHADETRCWSRHRTNFTGVFPQIDDALRTLPTSAALVAAASIPAALQPAHSASEPITTTYSTPITTGSSMSGVSSLSNSIPVPAGRSASSRVTTPRAAGISQCRVNQQELHRQPARR